jgi:hypothetical protein
LTTVSNRGEFEKGKLLAPSLASLKNSLISPSVTWIVEGMRMNIVQGFLAGFPVLGVFVPVLPSVGDFKSSPSAFERSGVSAKDGDP